ncbi:hypothetical protein CLV78_101787 [Aliiruegeria haliotis]|uniref:Uncharacterized protein n=1 Tax=Aliiruegeria haliotis TaxID=1280846 RepID=A0A2T0RZS9_9RHOB|nr:hypothetical protein [Aliiruegeria haliotis]PRY26686.1 hypothetical protein CLV78_101787 [Aliiruegeria haliotis]
MTLTPLVATILVVVMVLCGRNFRVNWKAQEDGWVLRAWLYGVPAAASLLTLAFVPFNV